MNASELLLGAMVALLLGATGQSLRAITGLSKQADKAAESGLRLSDVFDPILFLYSLFLGGTAGLLAYLGMAYGAFGGADFSQGTTVLGILSAGYAGADFIEGFTKKHLPK